MGMLGGFALGLILMFGQKALLGMLCVAGCCSVLQGVAGCCSVLQCGAVRRLILLFGQKALLGILCVAV